MSGTKNTRWVLAALPGAMTPQARLLLLLLAALATSGSHVPSVPGFVAARRLSGLSLDDFNQATDHLFDQGLVLICAGCGNLRLCDAPQPAPCELVAVAP